MSNETVQRNPRKAFSKRGVHSTPQSHKALFRVIPRTISPYETELGDVIFVVDYVIDRLGLVELLDGRISILQTKKAAASRAMIMFHQHYLMRYWPSILWDSRQWEIAVNPDLFSFYLFFLPPKNRDCTATISSLFADELLGISRHDLEARVNAWSAMRPHPTPPSKNLDIYEPLITCGSGAKCACNLFGLKHLLWNGLLHEIGSSQMRLRRLVRDRFVNDLPMHSEALTMLDGANVTYSKNSTERKTHVLRITVTAKTEIRKA